MNTELPNLKKGEKSIKLVRVLSLHEFPYKNTALWEMKKAVKAEAAERKVKIRTIKTQEKVGAGKDTIVLTVYAPCSSIKKGKK